MNKQRPYLTIGLRLMAFFVAFSISHSFAQETTVAKKLVGSWTFHSLEYPQDISEQDKKDSAEATRMNAGIMLFFTPDRKYKVSVLQNKKRTVVASGTIKLSKNDTYLKIDGLEGNILELNDQYLKLFVPDKPLLVFRKIK